jgi:hypothetical protein
MDFAVKSASGADFSGLSSSLMAFLKPLIDAPKSDPSELSFFVPKAELR